MISKEDKKEINEYLNNEFPEIKLFNIMDTGKIFVSDEDILNMHKRVIKDNKVVFLIFESNNKRIFSLQINDGNPLLVNGDDIRKIISALICVHDSAYHNNCDNGEEDE